MALRAKFFVLLQYFYGKGFVKVDAPESIPLLQQNKKEAKWPKKTHKN
jgi:hypothetical protein